MNASPLSKGKAAEGLHTVGAVYDHSCPKQKLK